MKKIVLTLALSVFALAANAQLIISTNIGGGMNSGNVAVQTNVTGSTQLNTNDLIPMEKETTLTGGLKIGYKFGRFQFGVAGSYTMNSIANQTLDPTIIPIMGVYNGVNYGNQNIESDGYMSTKRTSYTVSPYLRYDVIVAGDVAIFAELSFFYTNVNSPTINAHLVNKNEPMHLDMEIDSIFTRPMTTTSLGINLVPGLSWQLNKNFGIDLYFDFLSIAYSKSTSYVMNNEYTYTYVGTQMEISTVSTNTITETTQFGGGITGTPLLTELGKNNWVRVGFNFTF